MWILSMLIWRKNLERIYHIIRNQDQLHQHPKDKTGASTTAWTSLQPQINLFWLPDQMMYVFFSVLLGFWVSKITFVWFFCAPDSQSSKLYNRIFLEEILFFSSFIGIPNSSQGSWQDPIIGYNQQIKPFQSFDEIPSIDTQYTLVLKKSHD